MQRTLLMAAALMTALAPVTTLAQILFNGGITADERAAAPTTGTRLVFFVEAGNFLAGVKVRVKDSSGKEVVNTTTEGPWLILDLPAGRYSVQAEVRGATQGGHIDVDGSSREYAYMFRGL